MDEKFMSNSWDMTKWGCWLKLWKNIKICCQIVKIKKINYGNCSSCSPNWWGINSLVINSFIHSFIKSVSQHFPPNLHNIINHKQRELGGWNFESMFTLRNMSHVMCHVSCVMCPCRVSQFFLFFFLDKVVKIIGGESVINGAYPV